MAGRKTIEVEYLKNKINNYMREKNVPQAERLGLCILLEDILHVTGNYKGFRYLRSEELPEGVKPGIRMNPETLANEYPDEYRRHYS